MDEKTLKQHNKIINRIGLPKLREFTGLTRPAINHWRNRGIPRSWLASLNGLKRK